MHTGLIPTAMKTIRIKRINLYSLLILMIVAGCTRTANQDDKPNIIYILADDLGYGELGVYGQQKIKTPNIDRLAKNGMLFTQHYSGAPVCAPARCILLTGKHPGHAYIRGNDEMADRGDVWNYASVVEDPNLEGQRPLPDGTITLGNLMQNAGYKTALIGKWGLGGPLTESIPTKKGFDFFFGYNCQRQAHQLYPKHLWKNEEKVVLSNDLIVPGTKLKEGDDPNDHNAYKKYTQNEYAPALQQKEALRFIEANKNRPFFLYYATNLPHLPLQVPEEYVDRYHKIFGEEEAYLGDKGYFPSRYPNATYAGMITYLDDQVGELVALLEKLELFKKTIIIFTSDNGPTYTGGVDAEYFNSANPFSNAYGRTKGFVNEGGIRVPMIVQWAGKIKPGSKTDHVSAFWDIMPTLAELAGIDSGDTDGISFLPTLLQKQNQQEHTYLYWEFPEYGGQQAVRMGKWKGVRKDIQKGNLTLELYDLSTDLREENDLASRYPEIVRQIEMIMQKEHVPSSVERFKMKALGD